MKNKNILIITNDFLPYYSSIGGVIRVLSLAEYLQKQRIEVYILTSKGNYYGYFGNDNIREIAEIKYVFNPLKKIIDKKNKSFITYDVKKNENKIKRCLWEIFKDMMIPDYNNIMIFPYTFHAIKLIRKYAIKNVFISSPPHSIQLAGYILKKIFGNKINYIADYRDSWNGTSIFRKKNKFAQKINKYLESKIINSLDYFTYVSLPQLRKINTLFNVNLNGKGTLIRNGYHLSINVTKPIKNNKIKIGYFGSASDRENSIRDISILLNVIAQNSITDIELNFYGFLELTKLDVSQYSFFYYWGTVDQRESVNLMMEMDYLLVYHSEKVDADEVITGKFFEYINVGKPIICIGPEIMEAKHIIEDYKLGINIDLYNKTEMINSLKNLSNYEHSPLNFDKKEFSREYQYSKLLKLLV